MRGRTRGRVGQSKVSGYYSGNSQELITTGRVRSFVINGDELYLVCSYADESHEHYGKTMGNIKELEGITLPEILIPTDRPAYSVRQDPESLIGTIVDVAMSSSGSRPKYAILGHSTYGTNGEMFSVSLEHILQARSASPDLDISSIESRRVLRDVYGYSDSQVDGLLSMIIDDGSDVDIKGRAINVTTDAPSPYHTHTNDTKGYTVLPSLAASIVRNLPTGRLKGKQCYLPPKAFTGK